jgi:Protein of unknown function (DUF3300)
MRKIAVAILAAAAFAGSEAAVRDGQAQQSSAKSAGAKPVHADLRPESLDQLLAPVALYPDQLLAQILLCAANPGKVAMLGEWLNANEKLTGSALQDAAVKSGFEPSFVALVLFPQVVDSMIANMEWTRRLGEAFAADRTQVFASIQRLRGKAQAAGKLKDTPQQDIETRTTSSGEQVIVIEPANPQVVYVPQYNSQTVYTQPTSTTVVVQESSSSADAVAAGMIGFTAGIALGAAFDNDYYYGPYGWHGGAYMYNDAWDDYYDHREDAREDWADHREDLAEERGDVARNAQEQRTERAETRQENRPEAQAQRTERQQTRQENRPETQAQREQRRTDAQASRQSGSTATATQQSRGYSGERAQQAQQRSGTRSDAFSGYSSGRSERAASQRGQRSRGSSRGGRR